MDRPEERAMKGADGGSHGVPRTRGDHRKEKGGCRHQVPIIHRRRSLPLLALVAFASWWTWLRYANPANQHPSRDRQMGSILLSHLSDVNTENLGIAISERGSLTTLATSTS